MKCPHCKKGELQDYGGRFLIRCNNWEECARYVIAD